MTNYWTTLKIWLSIVSLFLLFIQLRVSGKGTANFRAIEKRILDSIIGDGRYDSRIRPSGVNASQGQDGPALVSINIYVRSISSIDDVTMEYSCQVTFREQWNDNRLQFDDMQGKIQYLVLTDPNRIWKPDLFFSNEKKGHFHEIIMPNVLLRIYPNGNVLFSIRISLVLSCPMDLKYYPLDRQTCSIQMASYGYTTDDLVFMWKEGDPVQVTKSLNLPRFTLQKYLTNYCTSRTNTGEYSCLKVDLLFKREFSYYLIQIYIPCAMLIFVSWVSFWLDPNATVARVSLGVTTLLSMATQISGINASQPPVSYTKAIDVWTGVCLTFVFGALLEFALVNYASRSDVHQAAAKQQQQVAQRQAKWNIEHSTMEAGGNGDETTYGLRGDGYRSCEIHAKPNKRKNWCKRWLSKFPTRSKRIDVISRIFFPFMFALFNLVYWTTYLFRDDLHMPLK
ncbi:glutamate-gated chloride channel-like [Oppia nitens]|uniref:glutamate-gated chloride channel-like n=1 Tax=Oppia nitens TaxID=1686743 RepID=UPI0023D9A028|nr:glutamate-gated chloride channel-like [Oppia nitens]